MIVWCSIVNQEGSPVTDLKAIRDAIIAGLAEAQNHTTDEVEKAIQNVGGDGGFEIESKTPAFVSAYVEQTLGLGVKLPTPCDLGPDQYATIAALIGAIAGHLNITS